MNKDKFVINHGTYLKPHYPYAVLFLESCTSILVLVSENAVFFFSPLIPFVHPSWHSVTLGGGGIRDMQIARRKVSTSSPRSLVQPFVSRRGEQEAFGRRGAAAPRLGAGLAAQTSGPSAVGEFPTFWPRFFLQAFLGPCSLFLLLSQAHRATVPPGHTVHPTGCCWAPCVLGALGLADYWRSICLELTFFFFFNMSISH